MVKWGKHEKNPMESCHALRVSNKNTWRMIGKIILHSKVTNNNDIMHPTGESLILNAVK